ncbi:MAG TPA: acyl-CoA dehydrogenase family protein [Spirochaetota bacterium]|nr:acyl-CoA dehydrogenase family protein [Spirochaetota bacterium]
MGYRELNLQLTDEQMMLKESVHKFAVNVLKPASIELDKMTPEEVVKKGSPFWKVMKQMYEMKYHTVLVPDEYGGMGLDPLSLHIFFEELSYGSVGFAVASGVACFPSFYASMVPEDHLIENIILPYVNCTDATNVGCWAITEPDHGSDILMSGTEFFHDRKITQSVKAQKNGDRWIINGQTSAWVSCGPLATSAALSVGIDPSKGMAGGGICLIDCTQKGVTKGKPLDKMGQRDLPQGEIFFDNAEVPEDYMIVDPDSYEAITDTTLAIANACMGAFFTGVAQSAYDLAVQYAKERVQGGVPIIKHSTVKEKLFYMFRKIELARAYSRSTLVYNFSTTPPHTQYSIASKTYCTQIAYEVASDAMQMFGGYGVTREYPIEKIFRDARAGLIEDGSNDSLALAAADLLFNEKE